VRSSFRRKKRFVLAAVCLLLALCILDLTVYKDSVFESFGGQFVNEERTHSYGRLNRGVTATEDRRLSVERGSIEEVALSLRGGKLAVGRSDGSSILLSYTVTVSDRDKEAAQRRLERVTVKGTTEGGRLAFEASESGRPLGIDRVAFEYELLVPDGLKVSLEAAAATVAVRSISGDMDIKTEGGMAELTDTTGKVTAIVDSASLYLSGLQGNVSVDNRYGYLSVEEVQGDVKLTGIGGETFVAGVTGRVSGDIQQGSAHLRDIRGPATMAIRSASLLLDGVRGDIDATSSGGEVRLVLPASEGYALELEAAQGGTVLAPLWMPAPQNPEDGGRSVLSTKLGDGAHRVNVKTSGASISVHVR